MSKVEEIEQAIGELPPEDFRRLAVWFRNREQSVWDEQMDQDSASGRLDDLFAEADSNDLAPWPEA